MSNTKDEKKYTWPEFLKTFYGDMYFSDAMSVAKEPWKEYKSTGKLPNRSSKKEEKIEKRERSDRHEKRDEHRDRRDKHERSDRSREDRVRERDSESSRDDSKKVRFDSKCATHKSKEECQKRSDECVWYSKGKSDKDKERSEKIRRRRSTPPSAAFRKKNRKSDDSDESNSPQERREIQKDTTSKYTEKSRTSNTELNKTNEGGADGNEELCVIL